MLERYVHHNDFSRIIDIIIINAIKVLNNGRQAKPAMEAIQKINRKKIKRNIGFK